MEELKKWVQEGINRDTIKWAETFATNLAKPDKIKDQKGYDKTINAMTTSQLRKFFGEIKRIQAIGFDNQEAKDDILMLKPKLAYANGRDKNASKLNEFYKKMSIALDAIDTNNEKHFINFVKIFEAIVAYHKAAGGQ